MLGIVTVSLALISLLAAIIAIGWLLIVNKHLSILGQRVLESEDIGRIIQAADKVGSFESRMGGCENKADKSQQQLSEHETKLSELIARQQTFEQKTDRHSDDLTKMSDQLSELQTKMNELASKLESVEQTTNGNGTGLAELVPSIKELADEIQNFKKFQTDIENTRSLILTAFADTRASEPPKQDNHMMTEINESEQTSNCPENTHEESEDQQTSAETYNLQL